jgi:hypothetical protein
MAFEYQCPDGQHWNAMRNYCDFPGNANCQLNGGIINGPNTRPNFPVPQPPVQLPQVPQWPDVNSRPDFNPNQRFQHPIVIPMAPRS